jgi:hypothetical protein
MGRKLHPRILPEGIGGIYVNTTSTYDIDFCAWLICKTAKIPAAFWDQHKRAVLFEFSGVVEAETLVEFLRDARIQTYLDAKRLAFRMARRLQAEYANPSQ